MEMPQSRKSLDNVGVRFRDRAEQTGDRDAIQMYRAYRSEELGQVFRALSEPVRDHEVSLSGRLKRSDTIIRKLRRERTMKLTFMNDIIGLRIIAASPLEQAAIAYKLKQQLDIKYFNDYTSQASQSGYRGIHIIGVMVREQPGRLEPLRFTFEIQIRTEFQHVWSTMSESFGEQVKEGGGTAGQRMYLRELGSAIFKYEILNPEARQLPKQKVVVDPQYHVINFDKSKGRTLSKEPFFANFGLALEYYTYLENQFSRNLNNEITLLALAGGVELMGVSHTRYVRQGGRPLVPEVLGVGSPLDDL